MVALLLAAVFVRTAGETASIPLGKGDALRVCVTYGKPGSCLLLRKKNQKVSGHSTIQIPKNCWADTDDGKTRPVAVLIKARQANRPFLFLTLEEESGVYGYRKVLVFCVNCSVPTKIEPQLLGEFEFSDFGSWTVASKTSLLTWDADLSTGPHQGDHKYAFRTLKLEKYLPVSSTQFSKRKYNPGWLPNGNRPRNIEIVNDPLRELGKRWRWWGKVLRPDSLRSFPYGGIHKILVEGSSLPLEIVGTLKWRK